MEKIQVTRPSMPNFDEYTDEIKDLWESHWLTNDGIKHKQLEKDLLDYLKCSNIALFNNGHAALECIIGALELSGEVITTPFSFASTTHAIVRNNLKPVFCDINEYDYTIDVIKLEKYITKDTSAIVPVHVYGNLCNVDIIQKIADKYNLKVIYDAAHAFGETLDGNNVANYGDASIFSFHATKVFNTIEGGAVSFKEQSLYKKLWSLKNFGITDQEIIESIGGNFKMNEFQAAMGICNLRHVNEEIDKRKIVVNRYYERLSNIKGIKLNPIQKNVKNNYSYFPVVFDGYKLNRNEVFEKLKLNDIYCRKYFYPLINDFECYKNIYDSNATPVAKYIADRVLTLPLFADLKIASIDKICDLILD